MNPQLMGTLVERFITGNLWVAFQDFRMALPGMLLQVTGGYLFIKYLIKK